MNKEICPGYADNGPRCNGGQMSMFVVRDKGVNWRYSGVYGAWRWKEAMVKVRREENLLYSIAILLKSWVGGEDRAGE